MNWREDKLEILFLIVSVVVVIIMTILTVIDLRSYRVVDVDGEIHYCTDDNASFHYIETHSSTLMPVNNGQTLIYLPAMTTSATKVYDNPSVCK